MSDLSTEQEHQIMELIAREQKISAIKLYREATGASLKDAKDAVDAMEMGVRVTFPATTCVESVNRRFGAGSRSGWCLAAPSHGRFEPRGSPSR